MVTRFEEMIGFHTREQARCEAETDRWVNRLFGRSNGFAEAAYAHECAIQHLKTRAGEAS